MSRQFSDELMNVFKTRLEDYFRLCFWGWNQVSQKSFPNPNQVVFVPKPNQAQQRKKTIQHYVFSSLPGQSMCSLILNKAGLSEHNVFRCHGSCFISFFLQILSPLAFHPGMTFSQALYLSARCLRAEDDSGNYPSTLLLPEQFSCALAVSSEQQMKETCRDALGVWDQHAA